MKPNRNILLVDDSEEHLLLISQFYKANGYALECAKNGQEALDFLKAKEGTGLPAFILLDLVMPVMDGYEFRKFQLQDSQLAKIPVVILTSDGQIEKKTMQMGAAGYVKKPVEISRLLEEAERFCL